MRRQTTDLINKKFGRLLVLSYYQTINWISYWKCLCICGKIHIVRRKSLIAGHVRSCGCLNREPKYSPKTHGMSETPTYKGWGDMKRRCNASENHKLAKNYSARGITVCERWLKFENFFADMGERPLGKTIERTDNKKGYFKENCYWATRKQQARNRRTNRLVTFRGETKCLAEWSELTGIKYSILRKRLNIGWSSEEAFTIKKGKKRFNLE